MCYPITHAWYVNCPITQSNYKPDAYTFPLELKSGWWLPIMFKNFVMVLISQCRFKLETNYQILSRHFCQQISLLVRFFKLINVSIKDFCSCHILLKFYLLVLHNIKRKDASAHCGSLQVSWKGSDDKDVNQNILHEEIQKVLDCPNMGGNQSVFFF